MHFFCSELFIDQAKVLGVNTPILTFDQPLWLKATEIVHAKALPVVLIFGGFHVSFLGSIGMFMRGSGFSD